MHRTTRNFPNKYIHKCKERLPWRPGNMAVLVPSHSPRRTLRAAQLFLPVPAPPPSSAPRPPVTRPAALTLTPPGPHTPGMSLECLLWVDGAPSARSSQQPLYAVQTAEAPSGLGAAYPGHVGRREVEGGRPAEGAPCVQAEEGGRERRGRRGERGTLQPVGCCRQLQPRFSPSPRLLLAGSGRVIISRVIYSIAET